MTIDLLTGVEADAGLAVHGADAIDSLTAASVRRSLVAGGVPGLLASKDPTLWGIAAEPGAKAGLGWVDTYRRSRELLPRLAELTAELADLDRVVLCGTGGTSLAPQAITRTLGLPLIVLDSADPHEVRTAIHGHSDDPAARADRLRRTVVVLTSNFGPSLETDGHLRAFRQAFAELGLTPAETGRHLVVVTDPGSPMLDIAREAGAAVVLTDPAVGGSFSALTALGLVPSALAGVDVAELLDQAELFAPSLARDAPNPALALGAALGAAATAGRDTIALVPDGSGLDGLGDWAAHLIAGSTGKDGVGLLPVAVEHPDSPGVTGPDVLTVSVGGALSLAAVPGNGISPDLAVNGPLGAQFLAWQYATALTARVLGVDPFDRPDPDAVTADTVAILAAGPSAETPTFVDGAVEVHTGGGSGDLPGALHDILAGLRGVGYLAVSAHLDRRTDGLAEELRPVLADASGCPVTFGWGPSDADGRYHRTGPQIGSFLQITGVVTGDLAVPGRSYTFGRLQAARAAAERRALTALGRPVLRLHLTDRAEGVRQVIAAANSLRA